VDAPSRCVKGPRERRCPLVREACWFGPWRKIRRTGVLGLARRLSWPKRLSGGAAPLERTSRATSLALARVARSRGRHVSGRSGSQTRSLSSEGNPPRGLSGRPVLGPINLSGLALYKSGPFGTPGLFPCQILTRIGQLIVVQLTGHIFMIIEICFVMMIHCISSFMTYGSNK